MSRIIDLAGRLVGDGQPAYVVAEIGINHNGDLKLAKRLIDAAKAKFPPKDDRMETGMREAYERATWL